MQEHNKIQLYVGLEEGGCVDVGGINLVGFTLIETSELQDLKAERDALAATVEALRREIQSAADWFSAYWPELNKAQCDRIRQMDRVAKAAPQQHLAEIRAQAGELGYYNGFKDALVIEPPLPPATGTYATIDVFAYRVEQASRYAANQYADSIRKEVK